MYILSGIDQSVGLCILLDPIKHGSALAGFGHALSWRILRTLGTSDTPVPMVEESGPIRFSGFCGIVDVRPSGAIMLDDQLICLMRRSTNSASII